MKAIVVLSGGMDSAVLLFHMLATGVEVEAISINYAQRHIRELESARWLCDYAGVKHDVIDLSQLAGYLTGSSQSDPSIPVPHGRYDEPSMKQTVVPNRNMVLLSVAGAIAIARKADWLVYGAHAGDHTIYPDCRPEFIKVMTKAFELCDWHQLKLFAPFSTLDKGQICKRGHDLGVPFELTWTCYEGNKTPCGQCGACIERAEAFEFAGIPDPLLS